MRNAFMHLHASGGWASLPIALLVALSCTACGEEGSSPAPAAARRNDLVVDIWSQGFESSSWASEFNSVTGDTNAGSASHVARLNLAGLAGLTGSHCLHFQGQGTAAPPALPTYGYELRKLVNTSGYTDITLSYARAFFGFEAAVTVEGQTLTDRWSVRYSTVASPGAGDWTEVHFAINGSDNFHAGLTEYTVSNLPASSTLWLSFLGDFKPRFNSGSGLNAIDEEVYIDQIVLRGDNGACDANTDCGDGNACTSDSCNLATGACSHPALAAATACNDRPTPGGPSAGYCDGAGACVECTAAGHCSDDSNACTVGPVCTNHVCGNGPAPNCSDSLFCNGTETCASGSGCQAGTPPTLTDGIACTTDACSESTDQVTHTPVDSACDDFNPCTDDACDTGTGCEHMAVPNRACSGGYCNASGSCVGCTQDSQCSGANEHCTNGNCVCTPETCADMPAECGVFSDNGCGASLDCTDECGEGGVCDMSAGNEQGVCVGHCTDNEQNEGEEGRDCGGACPTPCVETSCVDGLDDEGDGLIDCDDLDCVEAGYCDRCEEHLLGHADWGYAENSLSPWMTAEPEALRFTFTAPLCTGILGPVELPFGDLGHEDFTRTDASFEALLTCLLGLWDERDAQSAVQPVLLLSVEVVDAGVSQLLLSQEVELSELFSFDVEAGRIERLRLVVAHASFDEADTSVRLDFRWEAIGHHDAHGECFACPAFDSDSVAADFCNEQCPCDIGEGGCGEDSDCRRGLVCEPRGSWFGYQIPGLSVCVPQHCVDGVLSGDETGASNGEAPDSVDCGGLRCGACPVCQLEPGCSPSCPCEDYGGPCSDDIDCADGSACGDDNARRLGQPHLGNLCWPAACEEPSACGTPACGPCEECEYWPVDCQTGDAPREESLAFGTSSLRASAATFVNDSGLVEGVGPHVLRLKAGSAGPLSLFEGARTNLALESSHPALWPAVHVDFDTTQPGAPFINAAGQNAVVSAGRAQALATDPIAELPNQYLYRSVTLASSGAAAVTASTWLIKPSGAPTPGSIVLCIGPTPGCVESVQPFTPTSTWARFSHTAARGAASVFDARFALNAWGSTLLAAGYELDLAMPQIELGAFPSSWIRTYGSEVTRDLDRVTMDARVVPPWLLGGRFDLEVQPVFGTADVTTTAQTFVLFEFGASDQWLGFESNGAGTLSLVAQAAGRRTALELPVFDREEPFVITVSAAAGTLETSLSGAVATGPSWRWPERSLSIGARSAGSQADAAFAWIGQPTSTIAAPTSCAVLPYDDHQSCGEGAAWCEDGACVLSSACGDGNLETSGVNAPIESCDDGNNLADDGCSPSCVSEAISIAPGDVILHEPGVRTHSLGADGEGRLLLVWQSIEGDGSRLLAKRITADGVATLEDEPPIEIASDVGAQWPAEPQVVGLADEGWMVLWTDRDLNGVAARTVLRVVARDGTLGPLRDVTARAAADLERTDARIRAARLNDLVVALWVAEQTSNVGTPRRSIRAQLLDATGARVGDEISVAEGVGSEEVEPSVACSGDQWIAVWSRADDQSVRARRFESAAPLEAERLVATDSRSPSVTALPGEPDAPGYALAWVSVNDGRVRALEVVSTEPPNPLDARLVADPRDDRREAFPSVAALGADAYVVGFGYADGYRDSDFRVLEREGHVHTPQPTEGELRALLMGPSNQRGLQLTAAANGAWFVWADDGMPRMSDPHALPNGIRMFLLGCPGCDSDSTHDFLCDPEPQKLLPDDLVSLYVDEYREPGAAFGYQLAVSGDRMVVGAYQDHTNGFEEGSAYVYERQGSRWVERTKLMAAEPGPEESSAYPDYWGPQFGGAVDLDGDTIVVGALADNTVEGMNEGSVFVYELEGDQWVETRIGPPDYGPNRNFFGMSVHIDGDWIMVGNMGGGTTVTGYQYRVYVFHRDEGGWSYVQAIHSVDPYESYSVVALDDGTAIISAVISPSERLELDGEYSVRIFSLEGMQWVDTQQFVSPQDEVGNGFGHAAALDGDTALIADSHRQRDAETPGKGALMVLSRVAGVWSESETIWSPRGHEQDVAFGWPVSLDGNVAIASSGGTVNWGNSNVHVYERTSSWALRATIDLSGQTDFDQFWDVEVSGSEVLFGALRASDPAYENVPGAVYAFDCLPAAGCGDGWQAPGEQCDDGNRVTEVCAAAACEICDAECNLQHVGCGNGTVDPPLEECDDDTIGQYCTLSPAQCEQVCTSACVFGNPGYCSDGIVQSLYEECDDGNLTAGDGCSASCDTSTCTSTGSSDATCDGVDDDCDDETDEDYVVGSTSCGLGACLASGTIECADGSTDVQCTPGSSTGSDNDCDGVNDDCDTSTDEAFATSASSCGIGACARTGSITCVSGSTQNSCSAGSPTGTDNDCDGVDDDCDTQADEAYASAPTTCGVGACVASGQSACVGGSVVPQCTPGSPSSEVCNAIDDDCDGAVDDDCPGDTFKLESGSLIAGATPSTVPFKHAYASPVVVTTVYKQRNTVPVVSRVLNVTHNSFQVYIQNPMDLSVVPEKVEYFVVEAGVWNVAGFKVEAHRVMTTGVSTPTSYQGIQRTYGQSYTFPLIFGQVMTANDADFSVFWSSSATTGNAATTTQLYVGSHVGDDPDQTRTNEMLGYVVVDLGSGSLGGVPYRAGPATASNNFTDFSGFSPAFGRPPESVVAIGVGPNSSTGHGWVLLAGDPTASSTGLSLTGARTGHGATTFNRGASYLAFERPITYPAPTCGNSTVEPGESCDEGDTVTEYCPAGQSCQRCSATCELTVGGYCGDGIRQTSAPAAEACDDHNLIGGDGCSADCTVALPKLEAGVAAQSVGASPVSITFKHTYPTPPVVVTVLHYKNNTQSVVVRVRDVTTTGFVAQLQNPSGLTPVADQISYLAIEEGVWQVGSLKLEAHRHLSRRISWRGTNAAALIGEKASYGQSYVQPVVLGQVMTMNDPSYSVFWSSNGNRDVLPSTTQIYIGKHIGQIASNTPVRVDEELGYVVLEASAGTLAGIPYRAGTSAANGYGVTTRGPATFVPAMSKPPEVNIITLMGQLTTHEMWAYVAPEPSASSSTLFVHADRTRIGSTGGGNAYAGYLSLERPLVYPAPTCGNGNIEAGETCDDEGQTLTEYCGAGQSCPRCSETCEMTAGGYCGDGIRQTTAPTAEACDDHNVVDGDGCSADCTVALPKLEAGLVPQTVGGTAVNVTFKHVYPTPPVVVTVLHYKNNTQPVVVRVRDVTTTGFVTQLQNPLGLTPVAEKVSYLAVEEGVWQIGALKLEAHRQMSRITSYRIANTGTNVFVGEPAFYGQTYATPVVLGQVMTMNDANYSVFWSSNGNRDIVPSPTQLYVGKHVGETTNPARADEELGYVVLEGGGGTLGGVAYRAAISSGTRPAISSTAPFAFSSAFALPPEVSLATPMSITQTHEHWFYLLGDPPASAAAIYLATDRTGASSGAASRDGGGCRAGFVSFERSLVYPAPTCGNNSVEAGETCDEDNAITEYCPGGVECQRCGDRCTLVPGGYCGDGLRQSGEACDDGNTSSSDACNADCTVASPHFESGAVNIGATPTTVTLQHTYARPPVVVATGHYTTGVNPFVVRVRNVDADSFEIYLQSPGALSPPSGQRVTYLVVDEGVWNLGGVKLEARRQVSTSTSYALSNGSHRVDQRIPYGQAYTAPVVLGQVMTANDTQLSFFCSSDGSPTNPPSATQLYVGKDIGWDTAYARADETLGVIVIEAGSGTLAGVNYRAAVGAANVLGVANLSGGPRTYTFASPFASAPQTVLATTTANATTEGAWGYVYGVPGTTTSLLSVVADRTGASPALRSTVNARIAYLALESDISN